MNFQLLVFEKLDQTDLEISKNLHREHSANKTHPSSRGQKMKHKRNENCHFYSFQNNQKVLSLRENDASKFIKEQFIKGIREDLYFRRSRNIVIVIGNAAEIPLTHPVAKRSLPV